MANLNAVLRQEIARVSRKEIRVQTKQLKSASTGYRKAIAGLRRQVADQSRAIARLKRGTATGTRAPAESEGSAVRFRAGGVAAHRKRLGLSAENFGKLVGVTGQTVYSWEKGKRPRAAQIKRLSEIRALGKREASERISAAPAKKPRTKRRVTRKNVRR